jgi:ribosomal protein S6
MHSRRRLATIILQRAHASRAPPRQQAAMWQLTFAANSEALREIDHSLRVDERVLRWAVLKRRAFGPLPNPFRVARAAERVAGSLQAGQQQQQQQPAE